jgi:hypothetical protein
VSALAVALAIGALYYWRTHNEHQPWRLIAALGGLMLVAIQIAGKGVPCPKCGVALAANKDPPDFCPACGKDLREPTAEKPVNPIS